MNTVSAFAEQSKKKWQRGYKMMYSNTSGLTKLLPLKSENCELSYGRNKHLWVAKHEKAVQPGEIS